MNITKKDILRHALAPEIIPRLRGLFGSGFGMLAYFIALVYSAVKLLPENHPYTDPNNINRFGIRHVIAEAGNKLVLDIKNIDQIILFITIIFGLAIGLVQVVLFIGALFMQPVVAQAGFFSSPNPQQDLAHIMMDLVFGVPGVFDSCVNGATACVDVKGTPIESITKLTAEVSWPFPIHYALHQMLALYSTGLMVVGAMITSYFVFTVVAETAQTGTPFGKRYNKVWAPIRLIVAFGLLMPIGYGLNSGQYIVLYSAKLGSGFASSGWSLFNNTLTNEYLGQVTDLVSEPSPPEIGSLLQFMFSAKTCSEIYNADNPTYETKPYLVKNSMHATNHIEVTNGTSYEDMLAFAAGSNNVLLRFGPRNPQEYTRYKGNVSHICGEINLHLTNPGATTDDFATATKADSGAEVMQRFYWFLMVELWFGTLDGSSPIAMIAGIDENYPLAIANGDIIDNPEKYDLNGFKASMYNMYKKDLKSALTNPSASGLQKAIGSLGAIPAQAASGKWEIEKHLLDKGWASAGVWYNRVAELNGEVTSAVFNLPTVSRYPIVMREVYEKKKLHNQGIVVKTRFRPEPLANGIPLELDTMGDNSELKANKLWDAFKIWNDVSGSPKSKTTGNAFYDTIHAIFGTQGLYDMRNNPNTHPLAQLSGIGRSLVESSINNIGYAVIGSGFGAIANLFSTTLGDASQVLVGFVISITMVSLTIGFILFYVVPFLPFIYFFFAVGGWIKGIFEALVGTPLWALAHIRIDGNGLPGQAASSGYYLIFEIFIRPILTVFGLLASISIFAATVYVLNDIWDLVTNNLAGHEAPTSGSGLDMDFFRGSIDQFFYTMVYAIVVYMMGMSSFKLIDMIPNQILRWMGSSASTFNDTREDPAQGMVSTAYIGSDQVLGQMEGPLKEGTGMISNLGKTQ